MTAIEEILNDTSHRPFEVPKTDWLYYQEWNRALFIHWVVPFELLRKCVPSKLNLDRFEGDCYISLVAFTMEKIRPKFFPSIGLISDFDEINVRTYVDNDNKKGVYFLNIEAGKTISAFIAKAISSLPYEKSLIRRVDNCYDSINLKKGYRLNAEFKIQERLNDKNQLDKWLTERYCLYLDHNSKLYRYDIHHKEWELHKVNISRLDVSYKIGDIDIHELQPSLAHYSEGIKVIAWKRVNI